MGLAVRDALGAPFEGLPADFIYLEAGSVTELLARPPEGPRLYTDDTGHIALWNLPPRRPLSCWLTCGGLALLAGWVGWPRKAKPVAKKVAVS